MKPLTFWMLSALETGYEEQPAPCPTRRHLSLLFCEMNENPLPFFPLSLYIGCALHCGVVSGHIEHKSLDTELREMGIQTMTLQLSL